MSGFDDVVDFVVVGSGGGSMCAGLLMRTQGKSVLILEKTSLVGGTTARSGGVMWIPNNRFMKRDGVEDSFEKATQYLDALMGGQTDAPGSTAERRRTYLTEAPRMVDFLVNQGVKLNRIGYWPDYYDDLPGGSEQGRTVVAELFNVNELGEWKQKLQPTFIRAPVDLLQPSLEEMMELPAMMRSWRVKALLAKLVIRGILAKMTGKHWIAGGGALQGRMLQAAVQSGIEIRTESPVSELIVENGAVKGVVTTRNGKPSRVEARLGVLVNAGGFARNQRMRDQYVPGTSVKWTMATPGDTGEMIEEMMRIGAATAQMDERVGNQQTHPPGAADGEAKPTAQALTASPHAILVDQTGVRYMNEGGSYMAYCKAMLERNKTVPAVPSWALFDSQFMTKYFLAGSMPGKPKPQQWYEQGYLKKADTIEGLAQQLKIDPAALEATVERFNGFVAKNKDEDFHRGARAYDRWLGDSLNKPSETLGAIKQGPFYAVPIVPGDVGTYGGVVTDEHARVLRADGSIIPGLYATGVSTASVMGRFYPGAGSSVGPSFVWGYVAAKHAGGVK
ncbi:3-oxosteroid 1-dehydrogenase [Steroidobacter agaridevorans]|uniref:3-oxosteroid 1-dehydrogenase n=1 Tax=Steroidobacter agaridevorans TaxID=2695856 RepID=A0A829Y911_9GAMM|nr:FAD-dependent oxidoreductase [Steroidobacter agaridevorans]GFE79814.1 3-oxosteroid 1-dehydrogenase [Steroidobacter agaridevorans]GFE90642.1 3-oxosteroid 1-dehydrogenase [Steroidobacter agaridevorans]